MQAVHNFVFMQIAQYAVFAQKLGFSPFAKGSRCTDRFRRFDAAKTAAPTSEQRTFAPRLVPFASLTYLAGNLMECGSCVELGFHERHLLGHGFKPAQADWLGSNSLRRVGRARASAWSVRVDVAPRSSVS